VALKPPIAQETDVLVIGGGAAGIRAAIEARDQGADVLLVNKGFLGKAGTTSSSWGSIVGSIQPPDDPETVFQDMLQCGQYINDKEIVRLFIKEVQEGRVLELESYGITFNRDQQNRVRVLKMGGHSFPRQVMATWLNGPTILRYGLIPGMMKKGVRVVDRHVITKILSDEHGISGTVGLNVKTGRVEICRSKSIVLATGNAGQLFGESAGLSATGDGYSLAYRTGAILRDMEFITCSLGLAYPPALRGKVLGEPVVLRKSDGTSPELYNANKEFFMERYFPDATQGYTKNMYVFAISKEVEMGRGSPHGGVFVDFSDLDPNGPFYPFLKQIMDSMDMDILKGGSLEYTIVPFYFPGGVAFNHEHESSTRGLFIAGEVGGGLNGAERIASTAMAEAIVFGKRAGYFAAQFALQQKRSPINWGEAGKEEKRLYHMLDQKGAYPPREVRKKIQKIMWEEAGFVRNALNLSSAKKNLEGIRSSDGENIEISSKNPKGNLDWVESVENGFLLDVAEMVVGACRMREESRGPHFREDFPATSDTWLKKIVIYRDQGEMRFSVEDT
jgi:succinate dehydrogenase/fumarate reductase flavoprotein subunit